MATVRDIIVESASRSNVCPRKRTLPADTFVDAKKLFDGILADYSNRNYITAYQNIVDFQPADTVLVGEGTDAEVSAPKIISPVSVLYKETTSQDYVPLDFIALGQFYSVGNSDYTVSWQPVDKNLFKLYFKPRFVAQYRSLRMVYNTEMVYNDDDFVNLPSQLIELITRALAYKMSVSFPRTDTTKSAQLEKEMDKLEKDIASQNASQRIITRESGSRGSLLGNFLGGGFIFR